MGTHRKKAPLYARVSTRSQTVLPRAVREALAVRPGDSLRYRFTDAGILIDKAPDTEADDPFATFSEWAGAHDDEAYGDL